MKRLIKYLSLLLVLLIVVMLAAPFFIPLDSVKKIASTKVKEITGRDLIIGGDVKATVFPDIGVALQHVSLSNSEGYSDKNIIEVENMTVAVELMPLLSGEVKIKQFVINKPIVHLEINNKSVPNWQFASIVEKQENAESAVTTTRKTIPVIGRIKIEDGKITYRDMRSGKVHSASNVDLDINMPSLNSALDASTKFIFDKEQIVVSLNATEPAKLMSGETSSLKSSVKIGSFLAANIDGKVGKNEISGQTKISLDDNVFGGDVKVGFAGTVPEIEATLSTDKFNLNHYLPKSEAKTSSLFIREANAAQGWSSEKIDLSGLKAVNAKVTLNIGSLLYQAVTLSNLSIKANIAGGLLSFDIPPFGLYGGTAKVSGTANANKNSVSANINASSLQVEPLLKDFAQFDRLTGTADTNISINGSGSSQRAIISSLAGNGSVKIMDGVIRGVNIAKIVSSAKAVITGADTAGDKTSFSELNGTYTISQGIVKNSDLAMKSPLLRVKGEGSVDLPNRYVDYRLIPSLVASLEGQGGADKAGIDVPIKVEGSFESLKFTPDVGSIVQDTLKDPQKIKDTVKTLKDSIKKPENVQDLLKGFR